MSSMPPTPPPTPGDTPMRSAVDESLEAMVEGANESLDSPPVEQPQMRAMEPAEEERFERETRREEFGKSSGLARNLEESRFGETFNNLVFNYTDYYSRDTGPMLQEMSEFAPTALGAAAIRGNTRGNVAVLNTFFSALGYNLDDMPTPGQAVGQVQYGGEDYGFINAPAHLVEGFAQFATVFLPAAASAPSWLGPIGISAAAGAAGDATAFDVREGNISTMVRQFFPEGSFTDELLKTFDSKNLYENGEDEYYARLMSALEGAALGELLLPALLRGGGAMLKGTAHNATAVAKGVTEPIEGLSLGLQKNLLARESDAFVRVAKGELPPSAIQGITDNPRVTNAAAKYFAAYLTRAAKANELLRETPDLTPGELIEILEPYTVKVDAASRDAYAKVFRGAMEESTEGRVKISEEEAKAITRYLEDPNRAIMISDELSPGASEVFFQEAVRRGEDVVDAGDIRQFDSSERNREARRTGRGLLNADMKAEVDKVSKAAGLTAKEKKQVEKRVKDTLVEFPKTEWQEIQRFGTGDKERLTVSKKKNGDISVKFKFKAVPYSFHLANPKDASSAAIARGTPEWEKRKNSLAKGLVEEVEAIVKEADEGNRSAQVVVAARNWYSTMRGRLGREWGEMRPVFTELLGGLSPQTNVVDNFAYAADVIQKYSRGTYDELLDQYAKHIEGGGTFDTWADAGNPVIKKDGVMELISKDVRKALGRDDVLIGTKYGINSPRVMDVLADNWYGKRFEIPETATPEEAFAIRRSLGGNAPKALNFTGNLMGSTRAATIDVWAARLLQRKSGANAVPTAAEEAVKGNYVTVKSPDDPLVTGGGFGMGQDAFAEAAERLRSSNPMFATTESDDLQALVWFLEKLNWQRKGWTNSRGAEGSFDVEADRMFGDTGQTSRMREDIDRRATSDLPGRASIEAQPKNVDEMVEMAEQRLATDNTAVGYNVSRNFTDESESVAVEITYGRSRKRFDGPETSIPKGTKNAKGVEENPLLERLERGEIRREPQGEGKRPKYFDNETGEEIVLKAGEQKKRVEWQIDEEPTLGSAVEIAARMGRDGQQEAVQVHRFVNDTFDNGDGTFRPMSDQELFDAHPNVRAGIEVRFKGAVSPEDARGILEYAKSKGIRATTITEYKKGSQRGSGPAESIVGIRMVDVPETRLGADNLASIRSSPDARSEAFADYQAQTEAFDGYRREILTQFDTVSRVNTTPVDTLVMGDTRANPHFAADFGDFIDESGTVRTDGGEVWSGRSWHEGREAGIGREDGGGLRADGDGSGQAGAGPRSGADGAEEQLGDVAELNQAARGPSGGVLDPRGAAYVDRAEGIALIKFFKSADKSTAVHEMGHAVRVISFGKRSKDGMGAFTREQVESVELAYGVKDGNWTRSQEERFAEDFEQYIATGGPRGSMVGMLDPEMKLTFDLAAAQLRDIYKDAKSSDTGSRTMTPEVRSMLDRLPDMRGLPVRYAPGKYITHVDHSDVIKRIEEAEAEGRDILDVVAPEDILGTSRRTAEGDPRLANRFDINTPEDVVKVMAHFNEFSRELLESEVLMRGKSRQRLVREALINVNSLLGRDPDMMDQTMADLLGSVDMRKTTGVNSADNQIMAASVLMVMKADRLVKLAKKAAASGSTVDRAMLHRASLEYQVVQASVAAASTNWGRMGKAMQGVKLPDPEELLEPKVADEFLQGLGLRPGTLVSDTEEMINGLLLVEVPRDSHSIGKVLRTANGNAGAIQKSMDIGKEIFVNNLLSGPKTWFSLSVFSPMMNMTLDGVGRFAGAGIMVATGDKRGVAEMARQAKALRQGMLNVGAALEYSLRALKEERGVIMPGTNLYDAPGTGAIRSDSDNWIVRSLINRTGEIVRLPSRAIMTFDEFFRQLNGQTAIWVRMSERAEDIFLKEAMSEGTLKPGFSASERREFLRSQKKPMEEWVRNEVTRVIRDGRIRDSNAIFDEALADPKIADLDDDLERAIALRDYYNAEMTDSHARNVAYTKDYATRAVFQSELTGVGKSIQTGLDNFMGGALRFVVPFFRTPWNIQKKFFSLMPTNIGAEVLSRSVGAAQGKGFKLPATPNLGRFHAEHLADLSSGNPRRIAEARGRQALGIAIGGTLLSMADEGSITGSGPLDRDERDLWIANGWKPFSMKIGDGYFSYGGWDPLAQYLALAADTHMLMSANDDVATDEEQMGLTQALFMTLGRQMGEKSYIQGIANLLTVATEADPERQKASFRRFVGNIVGGFIPAAAATQQAKAITDPVVRDHQTLVEFLVSRSYFGDSDSVAPRYNFLGEVVTKKTRTTSETANWLNRISVTKYSAATDDPIIQQMYEQGHTVGRVGPTKDGIDLRSIPDSDGKYTAFQEVSALVAQVRKGGLTLRERLTELFASEEYQARLGDETSPKSGLTENDARVQRLFSQYRALAFKSLRLKNPKFAAEILKIEEDDRRTEIRNRKRRDPTADVSALERSIESINAQPGKNAERLKKLQAEGAIP